MQQFLPLEETRNKAIKKIKLGINCTERSQGKKTAKKQVGFKKDVHLSGE